MSRGWGLKGYWSAASQASSVSPVPRPSRNRPSLPQPSAVAEPVEAPDSADIAALMNPPESFSVGFQPRFKRWVHLTQSIQTSLGLTKNDEDDKKVALATGRKREVRAPVTTVVEEPVLAKQWMMRYSEDIVQLACFEFPH